MVLIKPHHAMHEAHTQYANTQTHRPTSGYNHCVAVIVSGCGVYNGTDIHEASAVLVHLSRAGAKVRMFAPNADQMYVVNHCQGTPTDEKRNILQESILNESCRVHSWGFSVAKNLSDWAVKNKDCTILPHLGKLIKDFHKAGRPLSMCCISPILAAKIRPGCELTVRQDKECEKWTAGVVKEMGCKHVNKDVEEAHINVKNKLFTTCAFMCNAPIHKVFDGIGIMVKETLKLA
uniref:Si:ch211-153b23.5 n=1 Tax=Amphiprion percula TaxID=161767 RepID=A0A3P8TJA8_AMPPE